MASERYDRASDFLSGPDIDAFINEAHQEHKRQLEESYNEDIDEFVSWGDYSAEQGEELKRQHHLQLWAGKLAIDG